MPSATAGKLGPPKGVCAGRGRERMWLLAKRTQAKGRKGGVVREESSHSGWKVTLHWLWYNGCSVSPSITTCLFLLNLQHVLDLLICRLKYFLRRIKEVKTKEESKEGRWPIQLTHWFIHKAESRKEVEGCHLTLDLRTFIGCVPPAYLPNIFF